MRRAATSHSECPSSFVVIVTDILEALQRHLEGAYLVERELGRGGMATVYLAHDLAHERDVAIKVLNPDLSATIGADRFEREIKIASRLHHPHILGCYASGHADGLLYYVMPFVKGESVRERLDREGQLSVADAVRIVREVADALGFAHAQEVVHRDIKPENILLLENGHALVADFGIARAAHEGDTQKLTQTGMAVGTPVYMSPEQSTGEKVGPAADIYSLGCVLYEMLSGDPPFTGKNAMAIMARHAMDTVPSIRIIRQAVPDEVEEAIYAAMEKSPADRPHTAAEFSAILGTPMGETSMRRVDRHTQMRRIPALPAEPQHIPRSRQPAVIGGALVAVLAASGVMWTLGDGGTPLKTNGLAADRIAVMYFADASPGGELGYLADGLTEALITSLTGVTGVSVVSRGGVEPFRGSTAPNDSIATVLDVKTLVRGDVSKSGDKVLVSIQLVDGEGDFIRTSAKVVGLASNALALRDSLASRVSLLIREDLGRQVFTATGTTTSTPVVSCAPGNQRDPIGSFAVRVDGTNRTVTDARFFLSITGSANALTPYNMIVTATVYGSQNQVLRSVVSRTSTVFLRGNASEQKQADFTFGPSGFVSGNNTRIVFTVAPATTQAVSGTILFNAGTCAPGTSRCATVTNACRAVNEVAIGTPLGTVFRQSPAVRLLGF